MLGRIAHLSTAHSRRDIRVYLKECKSLAAAGYDVHYLVADGMGDDKVDGVHIHDIGIAGGRFQRMIIRPWRMLIEARKQRAEIYHFHDPELLLIACFLPGKVIYDSHEDVPRALYSRDWIPHWIKPWLSAVFEKFENFVARRLSHVIGATSHITERFRTLNPKSETINNYPLLSELQDGVAKKGTDLVVCYVGSISRARGVMEMITALENVDARLIMAGQFEDAATERTARSLPGWSKVDYRGVVSRLQVQDILAESQAGLLFFHPDPNHVRAQPNKMFEYMSAGLPVIASNFPLWREIIEGNDCGYCVDPMSPEAISSGIEKVLIEPMRAQQMGANGRAVVLNRYNWTIEEAKLVTIYSKLLAGK